MIVVKERTNKNRLCVQINLFFSFTPVSCPSSVDVARRKSMESIARDTVNTLVASFFIFFICAQFWGIWWVIGVLCETLGFHSYVRIVCQIAVILGILACILWFLLALLGFMDMNGYRYKANDKDTPVRYPDTFSGRLGRRTGLWDFFDRRFMFPEA